jgi:hypothetical protein
MLYYSVADSILGIMSQITEQNNIWWAGPVATIAIYLPAGFGSLYNKYIGKFKYRYTFLAGALGHVIHTASAVVFVTVDT